MKKGRDSAHAGFGDPELEEAEARYFEMINKVRIIPIIVGSVISIFYTFSVFFWVRFRRKSKNMQKSRPWRMRRTKLPQRVSRHLLGTRNAESTKIPKPYRRKGPIPSK